MNNSSTEPMGNGGSDEDSDGDVGLGQKECFSSDGMCIKSVFLPTWKPLHGLTEEERNLRAVINFVAIIYVFVGVSVVNERLMTAIDVITSKKKQIAVRLSDGIPTFINVVFWNETVANLTLVALGSTASEILLTIVEMFGGNFTIGYLGPCTIIGSAAYSLFIISGICIFAVPANKARKIKKPHVFFVTAAWSVFSFVWLAIILLVVSSRVIEIWEAALTCLFFPISVFTAYLVDKKVEVGNWTGEIYVTDKAAKETQGGKFIKGTGSDSKEKTPGIDYVNLLQAAEEKRREITFIISKLRKAYPHLTLTAVTAMAKKELLKREPKSKAYYGGARKINCWPQIMKETEKCALFEEEEYDFIITKVFFESNYYCLSENERVVRLNVLRKDGDINSTCRVSYHTKEGTAKNTIDYNDAKGTITFKPLQAIAQIIVSMKNDNANDNNDTDNDKYFYVHLSNPWHSDTIEDEAVADAKPYHTASGASASVDVKRGHLVQSQVPATNIKLCPPYVAKVTKVDSSHPGLFLFPVTTLSVEENCGDIPVKVCRAKGGKGRVKIPFHPFDGTAEQGEDYQMFGSEIIFETKEYDKNIMVRIINRERYEFNRFFFLVLEKPEEDNDEQAPEITNSSDSNEQAKITKASLGAQSMLTVKICESKSFKTAVDNVLRMKIPTEMVRSTTWCQQFLDAITVNTDVNYLPEDGDYRFLDIKLPTLPEYVFHFVSLAWKLFAALVPPTTYCNGWVTFFACLVEMAILVTIVVDLAHNLGCTLDVHDSFTGLTLVAIGVRLPDTLTSRMAVVNEAGADTAIGYVPACNTINIFAGMGITWTIAAIHQSYQGRQLLVKDDHLAWLAVLFCGLSCLAISLHFARRHSSIGGELGGPIASRILTSCVLIALWVVFLSVSLSIEYCRLPIG